jgi:hypothetical protein
MYIITAPNGWWLRGTTWTGDIEKADRFSDQASAYAAIGRAKKFMKPVIYKKLSIDLEP